jgi:plasmid stability protein
MAKLTIHNLESAVIERLKQRAMAHRCSVEDEARMLLDHAIRRSRAAEAADNLHLVAARRPAGAARAS